MEKETLLKVGTFIRTTKQQNIFEAGLSGKSTEKLVDKELFGVVMGYIRDKEQFKENQIREMEKNGEVLNDMAYIVDLGDDDGVCHQIKKNEVEKCKRS